MVIPLDVSSDVDSCSFVRDVFPVDMSIVQDLRREMFMGNSVWLGPYFVVKSMFSSVLDCIQVVFQPCLVLLWVMGLCDVELTGDEEFVLTVVPQGSLELIPSNDEDFVLVGAT